MSRQTVILSLAPLLLSTSWYCKLQEAVVMVQVLTWFSATHTGDPDVSSQLVAPAWISPAVTGIWERNQ